MVQYRDGSRSRGDQTFEGQDDTIIVKDEDSQTYEIVELKTRVSETAKFVDSNMQYLIMFLIILGVLILIMIAYIVCRMTREKRPVIQKLRSSQKLDPQFALDDTKSNIISKIQKRKKMNMQDDVVSSNSKGSSSNA